MVALQPSTGGRFRNHEHKAWTKNFASKALLGQHNVGNVRVANVIAEPGQALGQEHKEEQKQAEEDPTPGLHLAESADAQANVSKLQVKLKELTGTDVAEDVVHDVYAGMNGDYETALKYLCNLFLMWQPLPEKGAELHSR